MNRRNILIGSSLVALMSATAPLSALARQQLAAVVNVRTDENIVTQPWGERSFYAEDPFGNKLCFVDRSTLFTGHEK